MQYAAIQNSWKRQNILTCLFTKGKTTDVLWQHYLTSSILSLESSCLLLSVTEQTHKTFKSQIPRHHNRQLTTWKGIRVVRKNPDYRRLTPLTCRKLRIWRPFGDFSFLPLQVWSSRSSNELIYQTFASLKMRETSVSGEWSMPTLYRPHKHSKNIYTVEVEFKQRMFKVWFIAKKKNNLHKFPYWTSIHSHSRLHLLLRGIHKKLEVRLCVKGSSDRVIRREFPPCFDSFLLLSADE